VVQVTVAWPQALEKNIIAAIACGGGGYSSPSGQEAEKEEVPDD
jgi:hypothetical protein